MRCSTPSPPARSQLSQATPLRLEVERLGVRIHVATEAAAQPAADVTDADCLRWAGAGECARNAAFVMPACPRACASWRANPNPNTNPNPNPNPEGAGWLRPAAHSVSEEECLGWARSGGAPT